MKQWRVELITDEIVVNNIIIDAMIIKKIDYQTLNVDGIKWGVPELLKMSFAEIECLDT